MIAHLIRWSARNIVLVLIGAALATAAGVYAVRHVPLDAIPDLSDTQVIVYTEYPGQAPQMVEDQVTYPLSTAMLSVPGAKAVRGFSFFGDSFVYVIFEDGTDLYWARSRVLEYLNSRRAAACRRASRRPRDRTRPASAGCTSTSSTAARRPGRAAHVAGLVRALRAAKACRASPRSPASAVSCGSIRSSSIRTACRHSTCRSSRCARQSAASNMDVGGRVVELAETEYMVRGRGYLKRHPGHRADRAEGEQRHAGSAARRGARGAWRRMSGAASPNSTAKARSSAALSSALRPERARRIDSVKAKLAEIAAAFPPAWRSSPSTTARISSSGRSQTLQIEAGRGEPDRRASSARLPASRRSALVAILTLPLGRLDRVLVHARAGASTPTSCRSAASPSPSAPWSTPRS